MSQVDGDTDSPEVEEGFQLSLFEAMQHAFDEVVAEHGGDVGDETNVLHFEDAILQEIEDDIIESTHTPFTPKPSLNGFGPPRDRGSISTARRSILSVSHASAMDDRRLSDGSTLRTHAQVESYPE